MSITPEQTGRLLQGSYEFEAFGFSMLVARLKSVYERENTAAALQTCADEINNFLQKFSRIMEADFAVISKI